MNPDTNKFEMLEEADEGQKEKLKQLLGSQLAGENVHMAYRPGLVRPDGTPVPKTWSVFEPGEHVVIKDYTFEVVRIGESYIVFEPVGPLEIGKKDD